MIKRISMTTAAEVPLPPSSSEGSIYLSFSGYLTPSLVLSVSLSSSLVGTTIPLGLSAGFSIMGIYESTGWGFSLS